MLSLHAGQELDRIAAGLSGGGALALLLVDATLLGGIERRYGGEAYRKCMDGLVSLVADTVRETAPGFDLLVTEERSRGIITAFVFAPRSNHAFYREMPRELVRRVGRELLVGGRRAVYPYVKDPLDLPIGSAVVLHNPTVKPERLVLQAVEEARLDAQLEAGLRRREHVSQILDIILSGDLRVRYEAIVDLHTAEVVGYEALSRGPEGGELASPRDLFRRAEEARVLFELDSLCRRVALENAHRLPSGRLLFLNCLPTAIGDPSLRDEGLRKMLENSDLQPRDLVLEISESESIENFGVLREVADSCRELGIRIAIDDAGTGYASLESIMEIVPDFIKTDMVLVRGIDQDRSRQQIVKAMSAIAEGIGSQVIAEGIETEREFETLREMGVRFGQGYFFGAALRGND